MYDYHGFDELKVGQRLKVKGTPGPDGGTFSALEIAAKEQKDQSEIEGLIQRVDCAGRTLRVVNMNFDIPAGTVIKDVTKMEIGLENLKEGDVVKVKGRYDPNTSFVTEKVKMKESMGFNIEELQGNIDAIDAEPLETGLARRAHVLRRPADDIDPVGPDAAQFRMDDEGVPASLDGLADQGLVVSAAVVGGGIEEIYAEVKRPVDGRDTLVIVLGAIISRHAHAAEADGRDHEVRRPKLDVSHQTSLSSKKRRTHRRARRLPGCVQVISCNRCSSPPGRRRDR